MKTLYTLESYTEFITVPGSILTMGKDMPPLTGTLNAVAVRFNSTDFEAGHFIELMCDPNYAFRLTVKQFIVQMAEYYDVQIVATDSLPT